MIRVITDEFGGRNRVLLHANLAISDEMVHAYPLSNVDDSIDENECMIVIRLDRLTRS